MWIKLAGATCQHHATTQWCHIVMLSSVLCAPFAPPLQTIPETALAGPCAAFPQKNIKTNSGPEAERPEDTQMRKRIPNPHFLPKRKEQKQLSCATKRIFAAAQQTSAKSLPSPALHCRPSSKTRGTHHLPYQRDTCAAS